jgi:4-hydroxybenzoate polyprenyltransferase/phosphoserine phosphatase
MSGPDLEPPLFVDLDGTLVRTDLLWESLASALRVSPSGAARGVAGLTGGRAALKRLLAQSSDVDATHLPYRASVVDWLRAEAARGRRIYLATAADEQLAGKVAEHLGIFCGVIASDGQHNRKGKAKLEAIREIVHEEPFDYCGNDRDDMLLFTAARQSIVVAAPPEVLRDAQALGNVQRVFPDHGDLRHWWRIVRPHQWLKNLLVFVPLLTSFKISDPWAVLAACVAFGVFCLAASCGYLVNDVLDLQGDRKHPRKRLRPVAAGDLSIPAVLAAAGVVFFVAFCVAVWIAGNLALWLLVYMVMTFTYSLRIKRMAMFDVAMLAALYTVRVLAGGAAIDAEVSFWLLAFSSFLFFSLALVKRCGELIAQRDRHEATGAGRSYLVDDLQVLQSLGIATSVAAVVVFALFVRTPEVAQRYASPDWLWLTLTALLVWLGRIWLISGRGRMDDDPVVFAITNRVSLGLIGVMTLGVGLAALLH